MLTTHRPKAIEINSWHSPECYQLGNGNQDQGSSAPAISGTIQIFMRVNSMAENPILTLLADSRPAGSDDDSFLQWNGLNIERHVLKAGSKPSQAINQHFLMLWEGTPAIGEKEEKQGTFKPYKKLPGTITTLLPGIRSAVRCLTDQPVLVCSLLPRFLHDLELEADRRPTGPFQPLHGTNDAVLRGLMLSLIRGTSSGKKHDMVWAESLFVQLGMRLLFASRALPQNKPPIHPVFPRHLLRRVLDKMHDELDSDLSLSSLAAESGYSRAHFMRVFKAAMGVTPHSHLLELRLRQAQKMLSFPSSSVIDIAFACGFRSQAYFTTAFSKRFGLTPSFYRRSISLRIS
jgi:AraC family transcriptional regulator